MATIDWDLILEKGESAELNADAIEALVRLARSGFEWLPGPLGRFNRCPFCASDAARPAAEHDADCPIAVLSELSKVKFA